jgi:DNA-binding LacI/PurR family transcriptional regulator
MGSSPAVKPPGRTGQRGSRPASIKDIARVAQVSHSTVSRALRDSPLVNPDTAETIRRIARQCGYRANAAARSLATQRTLTVGVVVTNISDPFVAGVVGGIEDVASERGFSVFLANANADPDREVHVVRSFEERRVDGIVVTSSRVGAQYVPLLTRRRIPIVLLNNQHPSQFAHSVMIDNVQGSLEGTKHLLELGHRRIAFLGDRNGRHSDTERLQGYRMALTAAGVPRDPRLVVHGDGKADGAGEAIAGLLALAQRPTAIFCYNDMSALGAMHALRCAGLQIPADVSLVGFDDLYFSQYLAPPLTTIHQPMREMGRMAMETLLGILSGTRSGHNIKVPGELIVRGSTAAPRERS